MSRALSLKGILRRYRSVSVGSNAVSVRLSIMNVPMPTANPSLRAQLELLARREISFEMSECIYGWTAAYEQTWTHVKVRIQLSLVPDMLTGQIPSPTALENQKQAWAPSIESTWSDQWVSSHPGELSSPFTFEVIWTSTDEHHNVRIHQTWPRANMTNWSISSGNRTAAHEFGHMLGHPDEYPETTMGIVLPDVTLQRIDVCPNRDPLNTGTIMDGGWDVPSRLMDRFADEIDVGVAAP